MHTHTPHTLLTHNTHTHTLTPHSYLLLTNVHTPCTHTPHTTHNTHTPHTHTIHTLLTHNTHHTPHTHTHTPASGRLRQSEVGHFQSSQSSEGQGAPPLWLLLVCGDVPLKGQLGHSIGKLLQQRHWLLALEVPPTRISADPACSGGCRRPQARPGPHGPLGPPSLGPHRGLRAGSASPRGCRCQRLHAGTRWGLGVFGSPTPCLSAW